MANAAIIEISSKTLLEILDFKGGKVIGIGFPTDYYKPSTIELRVEHPDLPEVEDGFMLTHIVPAYSGTHRKCKRVHPPKKEK